MLTVLCAHRREGAALIDHFRLTGAPARRNLFLGRSLRLLLTGQGGEQCSATLERIDMSLLPGEGELWLNFGVAGGGLGPEVDWPPPGAPVPGEFVGVTAVRKGKDEWRLDAAPLLPPIAGSALVDRMARLATVDEPECEFSEPVLYDMEAAAIARFLEQRGQQSRLLVVKLVADGPGDKPDDGREIGRQLLDRNSARIVSLVAGLQHASNGG